MSFICHHDYYFLPGSSREEVLAMIDEEKLFDLSEHDQLYAEMRSDRVFSTWRTGDVSFRPTYKYERNTEGCLREYTEEV